MKYQAYRIVFPGPVHFGKNSLDETEYTFHADTLFSALCIEALRSGAGTLEKLLELAEGDQFRLTDAFPYIGNEYFLPKPYVHIENKKDPGDSSVKKAYKNMLYVPVSHYSEFLGGSLPVEQTGKLSGLGRKSMKTSVSIRGLEEPMPYRVSTFSFHDGNGLFLIFAYQDDAVKNFVEDLLDGVAFEGIGGKRSSGLGRFEYYPADLPKNIVQLFDKEMPMYVTLSSALPADEEMDEAIDGASYQIAKRSGFVASENYAPQQMRKRDLYVFAAGSCFRHKFSGQIADVSEGGGHSVYRYAKPFFMGIDYREGKA